MSKQIIPFKVRSKELKDAAARFDKSFPVTASWIRKLSDTLLLPRVTVGEIGEIWKDTEDAFKNEFIGSGENRKYREKCYGAFENIVSEMVKKRGIRQSSQILERILPALEIGNEALKNVAEIYLALVASEALTEKRKYYGLCFMYLILTEGLFDENIRIIYIFKKAVENTDIKYEQAQQENLGSLRNEIDPVFFEGYNSRIRNAIAHARFRYDETRNVMVFEDIGTKWQPEFKARLSLREFGTCYYDKIDSFCRLRTFYMILLGVRDLIIAPRPFGRTAMR